MSFNEALRAMLMGKKVRDKCWEPNEYIMLDVDNNDFIDESGDTYLFSNLSTCHDWEEYYSLKSGSRFVKDGQVYRVVSVSPSRWSLINVDNWCVVYGEITSAVLINIIRNKGFKKLDYKGKITRAFNDYYTKENIYSTDTVAKIVDKNSKDKFAMVENTDGDTFCISYPFTFDSNYKGTNKLVIVSHEDGTPILRRVAEH